MYRVTIFADDTVAVPGGCIQMEDISLGDAYRMAKDMLAMGYTYSRAFVSAHIKPMEKGSVEHMYVVKHLIPIKIHTWRD